MEAIKKILDDICMAYGWNNDDRMENTWKINC